MTCLLGVRTRSQWGGGQLLHMHGNRDRIQTQEMTSTERHFLPLFSCFACCAGSVPDYGSWLHVVFLCMFGRCEVLAVLLCVRFSVLVCHTTPLPSHLSRERSLSATLSLTHLLFQQQTDLRALLKPFWSLSYFIFMECQGNTPISLTVEWSSFCISMRRVLSQQDTFTSGFPCRPLLFSIPKGYVEQSASCSVWIFFMHSFYRKWRKENKSWQRQLV